MSTTATSGCGLQALEGLPAVLGRHHPHAMALQQARHGEDVADVVVHEEHGAVGQHVGAGAQPLQHEALIVAQPGRIAVQEERGLVEQALGGADALQQQGLRQPAELLVVETRRLGPVVEDDRQGAQFGPLLELLHQLGRALAAALLPSVRPEHRAVEGARGEGLQGFRPGAHRRRLHVPVPDQLEDLPATIGVTFHDEEALDPLVEHLGDPAEGGHELRPVHRLAEAAHRPPP